jgi:hypothetical protein
MAQPEDPVKACWRRRSLFFIVLEVKPNLHQIFRHIAETQIIGTRFEVPEGQPGIRCMIRKSWFNVHLVLGLLAAVVLIIVGLTGSILTFDGYYARWLNPSLWRPTPQAHRISESSLQNTVQRRYASAAIERIDIADSNSAHVFTLAMARGSSSIIIRAPFSEPGTLRQAAS